LLFVLISILFVASLFACASSKNSPSIPATPYQVSNASADFTDAVATLLPSVVAIDIVYTPQTRSQTGSQGAAGTGWIFDTQGHIVTNNHVVAGAQTITVTLYDGTKYTATGVQSDTQNDLAVIKISATNLKPAPLGDSSKLVLAQPVAALGNALDMGVHVTSGIVSNLNTKITVNNLTLTGLIETDATINPGNSGGILFTRAGLVVGIPNAGIDDPTLDPENFSYAISINTALPIINKLVSQLP
jgi:S1-C subfamily serine protease